MRFYAKALMGIMALSYLTPLFPQEGGDAPSKSVFEKMKESKRETELDLIKNLTEKILVVEGRYDHVQRVLDNFKIKYDLVDLPGLEKKDLTPYMIVFVNCNGRAGTFLLPGGLVKNVKEYVEKGGWLFTSDWAIFLTQRAFPNTVLNQKDETIGESNERVPVRPDPKNESHPFLRDVFTIGLPGKDTQVQKKDLKATWMIQEVGAPFHIAPAAKSKVQTLVISDELQQRYGTNLIAVTFGVGAGGAISTGKDKKKEGVVFHVIGHFYQQGLGNKNDTEIAKMYQMILNFVIEAKKARTGEPAKK